MAGPVHSICAGSRPSRDTALLFSSPLCGLLLLGPQSGVHRLSATATRSVGHILLFQVSRQRVASILFCRARASTGLELAFTPSLSVNHSLEDDFLLNLKMPTYRGVGGGQALGNQIRVDFNFQFAISGDFIGGKEKIRKY